MIIVGETRLAETLIQHKNSSISLTQTLSLSQTLKERISDEERKRQISMMSVDQLNIIDQRRVELNTVNKDIFFVFLSTN